VANQYKAFNPFCTSPAPDSSTSPPNFGPVLFSGPSATAMASASPPCCKPADDCNCDSGGCCGSPPGGGPGSGGPGGGGPGPGGPGGPGPGPVLWSL
jgi:hypothetical protein